MSDNSSEKLRLANMLKDIHQAQLALTEQLIVERGHTAAVQLSVLAIAEQLVESGHLDSTRAAERLRELSKRIEPAPLGERIRPQIELHAARLLAVSDQPKPQPPRWKPQLVK